MNDPAILKSVVSKQAPCSQANEAGSPMQKLASKAKVEDAVAKERQKKIQFIKDKLGAVLKGYKTRRILARHGTLSALKKEYYDLLSFTFGLQHEMR